MIIAVIMTTILYRNRLSAGSAQQNRLKNIRSILDQVVVTSDISVSDITEKFSFLKEHYTEVCTVL